MQAPSPARVPIAAVDPARTWDGVSDRVVTRAENFVRRDIQYNPLVFQLRGTDAILGAVGSVAVGTPIMHWLLTQERIGRPLTRLPPKWRWAKWPASFAAATAVSAGVGGEAYRKWVFNTVLDGIGKYEDLETFINHMGRHGINDIGAAGLPGISWNARRAYREYDKDVKRMGAAAGSVTALVGGSVLGYLLWQGKLVKAPVPKVALGAFLALGLASSGYSTVRNAIDDGNLAMTTATLAGLAGAYKGWKFGAKVPVFTPFVALGGMLAAGTAGYFIGKQVKLGPGHHFDPHPNPKDKLDATFQKFEKPVGDGKNPVWAVGRGLWNHFAEEGPHTQGATFGNAWKQRDQVRKEYSTHELTGALVGDLAAMTLMGAASTAVVLRVLQRDNAKILDSRISKFAQAISLPSHAIRSVKNLGIAASVNQIDDKLLQQAAKKEWTAMTGARKHDRWMDAATKLYKHEGKWPEALYLATAAMVGLTVLEAYKQGRGSKLGHKEINAPASAGIALAGIGVSTYLLKTRAPFIKPLPGKFQLATAFGTATALWAGLVMSRGSVEQFLADGIEMQRRREITKPGLAAGITVSGGLVGAWAGTRIWRAIGLPKARLLGGIVGAAAGMFVGGAFAPLAAGKDRTKPMKKPDTLLPETLQEGGAIREKLPWSKQPPDGAQPPRP